MTRLSLDDFKNFYRYYEGQSHQQDALGLLYEAMPTSLLESDTAWVVKFRETPPAPEPAAGPITPELMETFSGHPASSYDSVFCDDFNRLLAITGFDTDLTAFQMLMAQMAHETGNWKWMKEVGSEDYFTRMYEGRSDLGNTEKGDGARFSGCGAIMVTGRANFLQSYKYLQQLEGLNDPRFMAEGTAYVGDVYPFRICTGWLIANNYFTLCRGGDLLACTKRLNGGTNGLEDRQWWWDKARKVISQEDLK